ncbi:MAG: glutamine--fructose-6-phosphate transaminase (isomerizing) [Spirochaetia bacterium]|nr:glutamine--fructose-6-phosphate transaminase (isomerizing) [Spirochaetia bacterium]
MCGIVAYVGEKSVDSVLLVGLIRLEYRGYDSAGVAVIDGGEIEIRKQLGKIRDLEEELRLHPVSGNIGIGHTRWATHGEPSKINAHPHVDSHKKIAVVHNGIIENYHLLRHELQKLGHKFVSETDSEIIPHLIEEELKTASGMVEALKNTIPKLEGKFSFTVIYENEPDRIFFARNGSPLVYGKGKNESFLASDVSAVIPAAKEEFRLDNGQWGWVTKNELHVFDENGKEVDHSLEEIKMNAMELDKGGFEHYMLKEIYEQPDVIRRIISNRIDGSTILFPEMALPLDYQGRVTRIIITSAGTSWHAGIIGKLYFEKYVKIATEVDISSEFRYRNPIAEGDSMVIAISQSGETADTLAGIHEAKSKFCRVLSFVNNVNSTIARESDAFISLMGGVEIGVASTKAYTAQLLNLLLYSMYLSSIKWLSTPEERSELITEIRALPEKIETVLKGADQIKEWAKELKDAKDFIFLGRHFNHPTALEGALKLKEISYVHASGYAGGEFKHGPIALISSEVPTVCIAPQTEIYPKMVSNIEEVKARKGRIVSIYTEGDTKVPEMSEFSFAIPKTIDVLTPILTIIPLQLFSYYMAVERGCEPDQPRNLAKSVTVE